VLPCSAGQTGIWGLGQCGKQHYVLKQWEKEAAAAALKCSNETAELRRSLDKALAGIWTAEAQAEAALNLSKSIATRLQQLGAATCVIVCHTATYRHDVLSWRAYELYWLSLDMASMKKSILRRQQPVASDIYSTMGNLSGRLQCPLENELGKVAEKPL
jgi:hypothetical protein